MRRAFTLVEIMIVVAVIALLAAIAMPSLIRARLQANETMAIAILKSLCSVIEGYRLSNGSYQGATLNVLATATPPYIDNVLGTGVKQGYIFTLTASTYTYQTNARPQTYRSSGTRSFLGDESCSIWAKDNTGADLTSADKINANILGATSTGGGRRPPIVNPIW